MSNEKCDMVHSNGIKEKKMEVIDGYTIKYHANSATVWSKIVPVKGHYFCYQ